MRRYVLPLLGALLLTTHAMAEERSARQSVPGPEPREAFKSARACTSAARTLPQNAARSGGVANGPAASTSRYCEPWRTTSPTLAATSKQR